MDHLLRLATGSHKKGSGKGCAMNVVSWENGDKTITDLPACSDLLLAKIVQRVNDLICTHRDGDLLCPACSMVVLDLAHRTVGTGGKWLSPLDRRRVWVRIAAERARSVLHLTGKLHDVALAAIRAAEAWVEEPSAAAANAAYAATAAANAANAATAAANAAYAYAAAAAAANAANAAYAAAAATTANAAYAAAAATNANAAYAYATAATTNAAYAATATATAVRAGQIIDRFYELTGFQPEPVSVATVEAALTKMLAHS